MTSAVTRPVRPAKLTMKPQAGQMLGRNGRYEKRLGDLRGVYRDEEAFERLLVADDDAPKYWVENHQSEEGAGGLITGISVLEPGKVGDEYFMTRGHLHVKADRAELYLGLTGRGVLLLETLDGESEAIPMGPGEAVYAPGHWVHRSINVGTERFATLFCFAADAGQDYEIIERAGGMKQVVVERDGNWITRPNASHVGYVT